MQKLHVCSIFFKIFPSVLISVNLTTSFGCLLHVLLSYFAGISFWPLIFMERFKIVMCSQTLKMPAFLCNLFCDQNSEWHSLQHIYKCSSTTYIYLGLVHCRLRCHYLTEITFAEFMFISSDFQNGWLEVLVNHNRNYWHTRFPQKLLKFLQGVRVAHKTQIKLKQKKSKVIFLKSQTFSFPRERNPVKH